MSNQFTITPTPPTSIKLKPGGQGKISFTVTNLAAPDTAHDVVVAALLVGADGKEKEVDWLVAEPRQILRMPGGKTETVAINAHPPSGSPRGEHTIKLVIAYKDRPNDVFGESSTVICEVLPDGPTPPPPKPRPWWLIPVIAGGLVVVVGGALLIWWLIPGDKTGGLDQPCRGDGSCKAELICEAQAQKCLRAGGAECEPANAEQCASRECVGTPGVCALLPGSACDPAEKEAKPCPTNTVCDPARKTCLGKEGAPCQADADCVTSKCTSNKCVTPALPKLGDPCTGTCQQPFLCSTSTRRCVQPISGTCSNNDQCATGLCGSTGRCVERPGRPCSNNGQCSTGLCEQNICKTPELLRDCTRDLICGPDQVCLDFQPGLKRCKWRPGHTCTRDEECSAKRCNQGVCARDDGRCTSQNECQSPLVCNIAKQKCLKPSDQPCTTSTECNSNFCSGNRCAPRNLARNRPATQSSTALGGAASRAVDGNTNGEWDRGSVTHTGEQAQAWWQVDLGEVADIEKVIIYNRTDCCGNRLSNFDIQLSNDGSTWRTVKTVAAAPATATHLLRTTGRFVRIRLNGTNYLSLAEVEVYTP